MAPGESSPARVKEQQAKHWNAVADGWARWLGWTERNFHPLTEWLREAAGWRPGARVIDVACGPGYPAFAAAAAVRPGGSVAGVDISSDMVAVASRRAAASGVDNVEFHEMDAEALGFDAGEFDAAINAYGLMFVPEPARAIGEMLRVVRPGGRLALATWADVSSSSFFAVATGAAAPMLGLPPPDPALPGPFRFGRPQALETLLDSAGAADVRVQFLTMTVECGSIDEYIQIFMDVAWKRRVAGLARDETASLRQAIADAARPHLDRGRLRLTATSVCAAGRRA
jgi:SAM-dependent methyltransferase